MRSVYAVMGQLLALVVMREQVQAQSQFYTPLYFSLILSYGQYGFNSSGVVPAVDIALQQITVRNILPGYRLQYVAVKDSMCNRGASLDAFFDDFQSDPVKLALVGSGCSVATEPVAEISHRWNISQISPASASSTLSDRSRFKNYFRTDPTFEIFAPAVLSLLEHFKWNRIVFLTQNENLFRNLYTDVKNLATAVATNESNICCFDQRNITVQTRYFETTEDDPVPSIEDVFDEHYRIFLINAYSTFSRKIICEAMHRNLSYPRYVWITHGWYPSKWWTEAVANDRISCSDQQLEMFLTNSRVLTINHLPVISNPNSLTDVGLTTDQFLRQYEERAVAGNYLQTVKSTLGYDAVWALSFALNKSKAMIEEQDISETPCQSEPGDFNNLEDFDYSNGLMGCVIRHNLANTNFIGVSGRVQFDKNGSRVQDKIRVHQYRHTSGGIEDVIIGFTSGITSFMFTYNNNEVDASVFPAGVPEDGTPKAITHTYNIGLVTVYYCVATFGIVFAVVCIVFNLMFHKRKVIRLTSPNLNYIMMCGVVLMYTSVYVGVLPATSSFATKLRCYLHSWLFVIGYLLAFGTILSKMWRVYQIFHNPSPNKTSLKDWQLMLIVTAMSVVGLILIAVRTAAQTVPPQLVRDNENPQGRTDLGILENYFVWECYKPASGPFYCDLLIYVYLIILQIIGIVLAFQT